VNNHCSTTTKKPRVSPSTRCARARRNNGNLRNFVNSVERFIKFYRVLIRTEGTLPISIKIRIDSRYDGVIFERESSKID